jgi:antitoxin component YwqK of YwqJK toxin-antitoxin module
MEKREKKELTRMGKKDGLWTWYKTGKKREEGTYKNGKKDGL